MLHSPLERLALAYEPVWDRSRRLSASRLTIHAIQRPGMDMSHLVGLLNDSQPVGAPPLLLTTESPSLLLALLKTPPARNTWLEVPEFVWAKPESLELLMKARRLGHQLLWRGPLSRFAPYLQKFQGLRGVLEVSEDDALLALQVAAQRAEFALPAHVKRIDSPILAGHLYRGVSRCALADHALDKRQAWGLVGWPDDDLLSASPKAPIPMDQRVMVQIMQAADAEIPILQMERLLVQDPVVVYRLLRMVNSAAFGLSHEVESVRHALMMLGFDKLKAWLRSAYPTASADKNLQPLRHRMHMRARLMRLLLDPNVDEALKGELQLVGVLSQLDLLMKQPLAELLHQLPMPQRIFSSLVRHDGPYVPYLDLVRALSYPEQVGLVPSACERGGFSIEEANTAVLNLLATARQPVDQTFTALRSRMAA